jgi:START domain
MIVRNLIFLLFLLSNTSAFAQTNDWKFIKATNGISIYHKKAEKGNLKDVKIETTFDCNLSTITEALLDVPAFNKWIYKIEYSKMLKAHTNNHVEYYNRINMPWPSADRDLVATNKMTQNPTTKEVISEDFCNWKGLPEKKDLIRIKDFYAKWSFKPMAIGVRGTYIFHSDPGGDLPNAVINLFIDEGPVNSIKGLKKLIKEEKYINSNSHGIVN